MRTTLNTIVAFIGLLANNNTTFIVAVVCLVLINIVPLFAPKND
jgi:hypothetical protein